MSSKPILALPRFVVLKSEKSKKYVQYVDPDPVEDLYLKQRGCGLLRADGEDVLSSYAKFELEAFNDSTKGKSYFRLRSCYNNKYVVAYQKDPRRGKMTFVAGGTGGPVEELSLTSTLPTKESTSMKTDPAKAPEGVLETGIDSARRRTFGYSLFEYEIRFLFGPSKNLVINMIDTHNDCVPILADDGSGDILAHGPARSPFMGTHPVRFPFQELIEVIDWETLMPFPKHVAFKGDNGKYLVVRDGELEFSGEDRTDEAVVQEVVSLGDGTIRIKSIQMDKFWDHVDGDNRLIQPQHLHPENEENTTSHESEIFIPVKLTDNLIALRKKVGHDYFFCKRLDKEQDRLGATTTRIDRYARLTVEEVVLTKSFYDVEYRLDHVRVYNESTVSLATQVAANKTNEPQTTKLALEYTLSRTSNWSTTTGWNAGVSVSASSSFKIPWIGETTFEVTGSYEHSSEDMKGGGDQNDTKIQTEFQLTVPPNTSTKVSLMATKGSYDIPFHYTNRDTIPDGSVVINRNNDGVFTGTDCYNFRFDITEYPLDDPNKPSTPAAATPAAATK